MKAMWLIATTILLTVSALGYEQLNGYVTDNAGQITPEYRTLITDKINQIEKNTSIEIAVLTVQSLNGQTINQFSIDTAQGNGIGKKGKDNGLLITIAQKERQWRIEVGYGLEGTLTDAQAKIIGEKYLRPGLSAGNWGKGIYDSLVQIEREINKEPTPEPTTTTESGQGGDWVFWVIFLSVLGIIIISTNESIKTSSERRRRSEKYSGSYHSSGRKDSDDEGSLESDTIHHSYYSGGHDSDDISGSGGDSDFGGFGGGSFGGGGASGGF